MDQCPHCGSHNTAHQAYASRMRECHDCGEEWGILGRAEVVLCNDHKRYRYLWGIWISEPHGDKSPEFYVYQAGLPTVYLGRADTLKAAEDIARTNADWSEQCTACDRRCAWGVPCPQGGEE